MVWNCSSHQQLWYFCRLYTLTWNDSWSWSSPWLYYTEMTLTKKSYIFQLKWLPSWKWGFRFKWYVPKELIYSKRNEVYIVNGIFQRKWGFILHCIFQRDCNFRYKWYIPKEMRFLFKWYIRKEMWFSFDKGSEVITTFSSVKLNFMFVAGKHTVCSTFVHIISMNMLCMIVKWLVARFLIICFC